MKEQMAAITPVVVRQLELGVYLSAAAFTAFTFKPLPAFYYAVVILICHMSLSIYLFPRYKSYISQPMHRKELTQILIAFAIFVLSISLMLYFADGSVFAIKARSTVFGTAACNVTSPSLGILLVDAFIRIYGSSSTM